MIIWQMTLEEFLTPAPKMSSDVVVPLEMFLTPLESPGWHRGTEVEIKSHPGFATAAVKQPGVPTHLSDQILLQRTGDGWNPVGIYLGEALNVAQGFSGKGLGTELVLRCVPHRDAPASRTLTPAGRATLKRARRIAVGRAIDEGLSVPSAVRKEYGL